MQEVQAAIARLRAMGEIASVPATRSERLVAELLALPETAELQRQHMVATIQDLLLNSGAELEEGRLTKVMAAMARVPRDYLVHPDAAAFAYLGAPLDIGHGQTISHPQMVAAMTYAADIHVDDRVLDVGTGSGYQAAVAALLARQVVSIEFVPELAEQAETRIRSLGFLNIEFVTGDARGMTQSSLAFDAVLVAAGTRAIPSRLVDLLAPGGRLVMPVGEQGNQQLILLKKSENGQLSLGSLGPASFVPLTGSVEPDDIVPGELAWCLGAPITPKMMR